LKFVESGDDFSSSLVELRLFDFGFSFLLVGLLNLSSLLVVSLLEVIKLFLLSCNLSIEVLNGKIFLSHLFEKFSFILIGLSEWDVVSQVFDIGLKLLFFKLETGLVLHYVLKGYTSIDLIFSSLFITSSFLSLLSLGKLSSVF
jgi:hypothetical protein